MGKVRSDRLKSNRPKTQNFPNLTAKLNYITEKTFETTPELVRIILIIDN
ncbi:MAG: hypothetical protein F6K40_24480 [Okeania sp. SIO3I5]|nr:hypothetical protein [Okeania sp. SIO3I5]NEQ39235.1 hypothetical protein [Okeania sp. SIO3I5]